MTRYARLLCLLLAGALLGACAAPQTPPQQTQYLLSASRSGAPLAARYDTLRLLPLRASPPYDTPYFVYRETAQRYVSDPYRGLVSAPALQVGNRLQDWLAASGIARHVIGPGPLPAQVRLVGELTRLDVDLRDAKARAVKLELRLRAEDENSQALLLDRQFSASAPLAVVTPDSIAAAADQALASLLGDVETALYQAR
ncbi:ABC-type uncharacterized transport system, auxiliary component [Andreprevotia lacus DSM 23236]|jgi:ABC-type uncharacterized transport system auxiliary subunit|uniref:ABC-type uncharacterized transport system, auxiliary component n=1 Tax=Andreprevotia lacus DSM 23236 TaxID=1121001 RepID=A0A1W1XQA8_9NEIS|nr:ABC-type transport auxiliary lipoprotein family protein [Andreprevotia lacus]SMC26180.1 ABC-type uncharacterized transport system, auxiliary component [Andreprevotia lacus DSM 23236]